MGGIRINKYLAECGVASRRGADKLIADGVVTINGRLAVNGDQVSDEDMVCINGKRVKSLSEKVVFALYKPRGVTVTEKDEHAKIKITDIIDYPERLTYAGRLDKESEGLILMTNDGDLINAIMRSANGHEKCYIVTLDKEAKDSDIKELENGIYIEELKQKTRACTINKLSHKKYEVILSQGLNRQIRRMFGQYGLEVTRLKRVRVLNIELGNLKAGEYRKVTGDELKKLYNMAGISL